MTAMHWDRCRWSPPASPASRRSRTSDRSFSRFYRSVPYIDEPETPTPHTCPPEPPSPSSVRPSELDSAVAEEADAYRGLQRAQADYDAGRDGEAKAEPLQARIEQARQQLREPRAQ